MSTLFPMPMQVHLILKGSSPPTHHQRPPLNLKASEVKVSEWNMIQTFTKNIDLNGHYSYVCKFLY